MGKVTVTLTGNSSRLVKAMKRVQNEEKKVADGAGKIGRKSKLASKGAMQLTKSFQRMVGAAAGMVGASAVFGDMIRSIKTARRETIDFENELTDLFSLGANVENIGAIKDEVLAYAGAWGTARTNIIGSMFDIQSGASSLSKEMRDSLRKEIMELTKVTSTSAPAATKLMVKTWNIYGKELKTANNMQNKLFKTAELGFLNFGEMADYLADVLAPGKALGFTIDEILASLVTATQKGGKTEKTFTGLRNVFIRMDKAMQQGLTTNKAFGEQLEDLSRIDSKIITRLFGAETVAVINNLVSSTKEFKGALDTIETVTGDIAKSKFWKRMQDTAFAFTEMSKIRKQIEKSIPLTKEYAETFGTFEADVDYARMGFKKGTPTFMHGILADISGVVSATLGQVADVTGTKSSAARLMEAGLQTFEQKAIAGGRLGIANVARAKTEGVDSKLIQEYMKALGITVEEFEKAAKTFRDVDAVYKRNSVIE